MKPVKISVILSVYNQEKYIKKAIQSILSQSFKDFEFIIINDASTDNTSKILKLFCDGRLKIIKNKKRLGLAKSLNKAIFLAKGKYIARMDADDISHPNRLKTQYCFMQKNPQIAVCGTAVNLIDLSGNNLGIKSYPQTNTQLKKVLMRFNPIIHPTVMLRKDCLATQAYDSSLNGAEDYDLWLRLAQNHQLTNLQDKLLDYRINPQGISFKSYQHTQRQALKARLKAISQYHYPVWQVIYLLKPLLSYFIPAPIKKSFFLNTFPIQSPNRHSGLIQLSKTLISFPKPLKILDIGCGSDATYKYLQNFKLKGQYLGIDLKFKTKPKVFNKSNLNARFIETSLFKLPQIRKYDLILSLWNLEHIKDTEKALHKIKNLLKKSGQAIIIVPTIWTWLIEFGRHGYHYFSIASIKSIFSQHQLQIKDFKLIGGPFSLVFAIFYQWLAYLILIPVLSFLKLIGHLPQSQTRADIGSAALSRKILSASIYSYQKTKFGRWLHMQAVKLVCFLDKLLPITPTSYLIIVTK